MKKQLHSYLQSTKENNSDLLKLDCSATKVHTPPHYPWLRVVQLKDLSTNWTKYLLVKSQVSQLVSKSFGNHYHGEVNPKSYFAASGRIVGGEIENPANSNPWQVLIYWGGQCGGTLLDSKFVLTAAHCIPSNLNTASYVIAGAHKWWVSRLYSTWMLMRMLGSTGCVWVGLGSEWLRITLYFIIK